MALELTKVAVWSAELDDRPGTLAGKLEALERAGANLDFIIVRPYGDGSGRGVLYVAPLISREQLQSAEEVGLRRSSIQSLRISGPDRPGLGAGIARTLANHNINIAGLTASALEDRCVFYVRFNSDADLISAAAILTKSLG
ncbi:MAG: ACT domain-containing protein [Phycisphaerae bacterium]|jgi:hypothetical protein